MCLYVLRLSQALTCFKSQHLFFLRLHFIITAMERKRKVRFLLEDNTIAEQQGDRQHFSQLQLEHPKRVAIDKLAFSERQKLDRSQHHKEQSLESPAKRQKTSQHPEPRSEERKQYGDDELDFIEGRCRDRSYQNYNSVVQQSPLKEYARHPQYPFEQTKLLDFDELDFIEGRHRNKSQSLKKKVSQRFSKLLNASEIKNAKNEKRKVLDCDELDFNEGPLLSNSQQQHDSNAQSGSDTRSSSGSVHSRREQSVLLDCDELDFIERRQCGNTQQHRKPAAQSALVDKQPSSIPQHQAEENILLDFDELDFIEGRNRNNSKEKKESRSLSHSSRLILSNHVERQCMQSTLLGLDELGPIEGQGGDMSININQPGFMSAVNGQHGSNHSQSQSEPRKLSNFNKKKFINGRYRVRSYGVALMGLHSSSEVQETVRGIEPIMHRTYNPVSDELSTNARPEDSNCSHQGSASFQSALVGTEHLKRSQPQTNQTNPLCLNRFSFEKSRTRDTSHHNWESGQPTYNKQKRSGHLPFQMDLKQQQVIKTFSLNKAQGHGAHQLKHDSSFMSQSTEPHIVECDQSWLDTSSCNAIDEADCGRRRKHSRLQSPEKRTVWSKTGKQDPSDLLESPPVEQITQDEFNGCHYTEKSRHHEPQSQNVSGLGRALELQKTLLHLIDKRLSPNHESSSVGIFSSTNLKDCLKAEKTGSTEDLAQKKLRSQGSHLCSAEQKYANTVTSIVATTPNQGPFRKRKFQGIDEPMPKSILSKAKRRKLSADESSVRSLGIDRVNEGDTSAYIESCTVSERKSTAHDDGERRQGSGYIVFEKSLLYTPARNRFQTQKENEPLEKSEPVKKKTPLRPNEMESVTNMLKSLGVVVQPSAERVQHDALQKYQTQKSWSRGLSPKQRTIYSVLRFTLRKVRRGLSEIQGAKPVVESADKAIAGLWSAFMAGRLEAPQVLRKVQDHVRSCSVIFECFSITDSFKNAIVREKQRLREGRGRSLPLYYALFASGAVLGVEKRVMAAAAQHHVEIQAEETKHIAAVIREAAIARAEHIVRGALEVGKERNAMYWDTDRIKQLEAHEEARRAEEKQQSEEVEREKREREENELKREMWRPKPFKKKRAPYPPPFPKVSIRHERTVKALMNLVNQRNRKNRKENKASGLAPLLPTWISSHTPNKRSTDECELNSSVISAIRSDTPGHWEMYRPPSNLILEDVTNFIVNEGKVRNSGTLQNAFERLEAKRTKELIT